MKFRVSALMPTGMAARSPPVGEVSRLEEARKVLSECVIVEEAVAVRSLAGEKEPVIVAEEAVSCECATVGDVL